MRNTQSLRRRARSHPQIYLLCTDHPPPCRLKKFYFSPSQIINPNSFLSPNPLSFNLRSHSAHRPGDSPGIPHNLSPSPLPVWYLSLTSAAPTHSIWFLSWAPVVHSLAWPTTCHHSPPQLHPRKTSGYFRISLFFFFDQALSSIEFRIREVSLPLVPFVSRLRVKASRQVFALPSRCPSGPLPVPRYQFNQSFVGLLPSSSVPFRNPSNRILSVPFHSLRFTNLVKHTAP